MRNILFVVTSVHHIAEIDRNTGFYLDELAIPLKAVVDNGWNANIVSIKGGEPPIEYKTLRPKSIRTEAQQWLLDDDFYFNKLRNSSAIKDVSDENYDAIFMPGGHGVMWDFKQNKMLADLVTKFYDSNKIVASICHGPAGLLSSVSQKNNNPICRGKKVTCFTNEEEERVAMTAIVPYLVEDELVKQGGIFLKKEARTPHCVVDGNILTGQNPESSYVLASALIDVLS